MRSTTQEPKERVKEHMVAAFIHFARFHRREVRKSSPVSVYIHSSGTGFITDPTTNCIILPLSFITQTGLAIEATIESLLVQAITQIDTVETLRRTSFPPLLLEYIQTGRCAFMELALACNFDKESITRQMKDTPFSSLPDFARLGLGFFFELYRIFGKDYFDVIVERPPRTIGEIQKPQDYLAERPGIST